MFNIILTVIWLGTCADKSCSKYETVVFTTNGGMKYCLELADKILSSDSSVYAHCKYKGEQYDNQSMD